MLKKISLYAVIVLFLLSGCSDEHGTSPASIEYEALPAPENFEITSANYSLTLSWDYSPNKITLTKEFFVYVVDPNQYGGVIYPVDTLTVADYNVSKGCTFDKLAANMEFCFVVSAVDLSGIEGWRAEAECGTTSAP